jgi:F-type H+-transporting ATPase subunit b
MISLDYSLIPAVLIFLTVVVALNYLLFKPLMKIQAQREERTTGQLEQARKKLDHHLDLFNRYQAAVKNARMEGYRRQEQVRSEAMKKRAEALEQARKRAEGLLLESRASIQAQVQGAKAQLSLEAHEIARSIAAAVLQRSA